MTTDPRGDGWIQTFTGRQFWPLAPQPEDVCLEDIAHALALTNRFGGHTQRFYSVAQHSVLVSAIVPSYYVKEALLHDAAEAYLGDMPRPLKHSPEMEAFRAAEDELMQVIAMRYDLEGLEPDCVKEADAVLLATEKRDLMHSNQGQWSETQWLHGAVKADPLDQAIVAWSPEVAEARFLKRAAALGLPRG